MKLESGHPEEVLGPSLYLIRSHKYEPSSRFFIRLLVLFSSRTFQVVVKPNYIAVFYVYRLRLLFDT